MKINSQAYTLVLFTCTPPKAKKFLNNWVWVAVLLPESRGLGMQERSLGGGMWLGGSCVLNFTAPLVLLRQLSQDPFYKVDQRNDLA